MAKKKKAKKHFQNFPFRFKWQRVGLIIGLIALFLLGVNFLFQNKILFFGGKAVRIPSPTPSPIILDIVSPPFLGSQKYLELAIEDLSKKLKIEKSKITVVSVSPYNFADTSLGCPVKGKVYTPVIISGFIIKLKALGKNYTYHGGLERVVSCGN